MQYKKLDKFLLFSRNQVFCLKIWKLWWAPTILQFNILCWNFARVSNLYQSLLNDVQDFFIVFRPWLIRKKLKRRGLYTLVLYIFINYSRSRQNWKKSRTPFCKYYSVENVCKISVKNIKLYGSWSSSKFSIC